jgi:CubicO group peptidase (beta-lactamase class C family)
MPEQQGVDSTQLARMFEEIKQKNLSLNGMLVVRHGYIVTEAYFPPFEASTKHEIYSVTKSIISALVGIARRQGSLHDLDQKALDFFGDRTVVENDARKQAITLRHLLTMTSGLHWSSDDDSRLFSGGDLVQLTLDRPMAAEPGSVWNYNSGGTHLLSAILQKATGQSASAFAQTQLFQPLGITDVAWPADSNGVNTGGWGIRMTPRDMAKFGYLYLKGGTWDGQPVVPADWVQASTAKHVDTGDGRGYGYLWWQLSFGGYAALGYGGQEVIVLPEQDMVVVFTATPLDEKSLWKLVSDYIIPAAQSAGPLPENPIGVEALESQIKAIK